MSENQPPPAINPMPPIVTALFLIIAAVELGFMLGGFGLFGGQTGSALRSQAIESYGVNTMLAGWMIENQSYPLEHLARFVSCLLYTSPSPRDYAASRMPSSA